MTILQQILDDKRREVADRKATVSVQMLESSPYFDQPVYSLSARLRAKPGVIAEFKRKSPSKGMIHANADPADVTSAYAAAGAAGVSVLTDGPYFGGSLADLQVARLAVGIPVLRKEFIVDEYQILEAKSYGADLILLIAAALSPKEVKAFSDLAHSLGLEVLLELHEMAELDHIAPDIALIGVNNRNLKTFETTLDTSRALAKHLPPEKAWVAESGLHHPGDLVELQDVGYRGFLIGEALMKSGDPGTACGRFTEVLG